MTADPARRTPALSPPHLVRERRTTALVLLVAGVGVWATVFSAVSAPLLAALVAGWCLAVAWFALAGTSTAGFTAIACLVKATTLALIALAIWAPDDAVGIRSGLDWIPLGLLNMGTGLWILSLIRRRAR